MQVYSRMTRNLLFFLNGETVTIVTRSSVGNIAIINIYYDFNLFLRKCLNG